MPLATRIRYMSSPAPREESPIVTEHGAQHIFEPLHIDNPVAEPPEGSAGQLYLGRESKGSLFDLH
jgi:hypothetical protein